ncbi:Mu transposase domain-containing protein [Shigella sonnei]|uniref:Mu transposase domain-containing protein n=1 Tax=Shigella sonnei TaxID=624 RepID=UPI003C72ED8C
MSWDSYIEVGGNRYSVPEALCGQPVSIPLKSSKLKLSERFLKINFRSVKALPDYLFLKAL